MDEWVRQTYGNRKRYFLRKLQNIMEFLLINVILT